MKTKYDKKLRKWFMENPFSQTTVMKCEKCKLYYKPSLGHECAKGRVKE